MNYWNRKCSISHANKQFELRLWILPKSHGAQASSNQDEIFLLMCETCELLCRMSSSFETKTKHIWLLHTDSLSPNSSDVGQHLITCRLRMSKDEVKIKNKIPHNQVITVIYICITFQISSAIPQMELFQQVSVTRVDAAWRSKMKNTMWG